MAKGKNTCKILKEIRKQIAAENDIELITSECTYKGDCLGTCPKCEAEVRYLERELEKRQRLGKAAVFAGLSMGTLLAATGCHVVQPLAGMPVDAFPDTETVEVETIKPLAGDVVAVMPPERQEPDTIIEEPLMGLVAMFRTVYEFNTEDYQNLMKEKFVYPEMNSLSVVSGSIGYECIARGEICDTFEKLVEAAKVFQAPYYSGGEQKLMEDLASRLTVDAKKRQGDMEITFTVTDLGAVREIEIVKGLDEEWDVAVTKAFEQLDWNPASYRLKDEEMSMPFECRCVLNMHFPIK